MIAIWESDAYLAEYQRLSENQRACAKRWSKIGLILMGVNALLLIIDSILAVRGVIAPSTAFISLLVQAFAFRQIYRFVSRRIDTICAATQAVAEQDSV